MRSAIVAAAFAANVLAVPFVKRDEVVVTDIDIVYATDIVTVYATAGAPPASTPDANNNNFGHWGHSWGGAPWSPSSAYVPPAPETTTTSVYTPPPAPATTSTTSVYTPPPAPATTSTTSVYTPPPAPTSTWVAPAPAAPATTAAPGGTWGDDVPAGADVATGTFQVNDPVTWTESAAYTAYSDVVVAHHNFHRFNHSSQMLAWNESLAKSAQDLANTCSYGHNTEMDGGGYGQNIAAGVDMNNITTVITDLFYNGEAPWYDGLYGQAQPDMTNFEHWGHFSQIVWNETLSVACATSNCTAGGLGNVGSDTPPFFTVCNYWPSGNWAGEYGANIGSPKNIPTIQWNAS